jgi:methionine synthase II (cobalamin-independent)
MTFATGVGSMPGDDQRAYDEALGVVLGELPDLPHLPEVPGRGATATMTGRALAIVAELGADLQPAGWRLTDAPGIDQRRARSLLAQDLDTLEEKAEGYVGAFKVQVAGPWTLAATVERPRGDRILADHGARRELAQALAEGVRDHVRDVRRRLPGVDRIVVQVDEPALAAVLGGRVPTASGFGRHRTVDEPEASDALGWVLAAIAEEGAEPWVHTCAAGTPLELLRGAGARGLSVDLDLQGPADHDVLAEALEAGDAVVLGMVPTTEAETGEAVVVERVLRWLDLVGLDPATVGNQLGISGTCGLAGASQEWARRALQITQRVATELTD